MKLFRFCLAGALCLLAIAVYVERNVWQWRLPPHFPVPQVPDNNPMSKAKVELGRHLFYDNRLSANEEVSCSSCHKQHLAFADGLPLSFGLHDDETNRNAMSLTNVAYNANYTWANPLVGRLQDQALLPLFGEDPPEMGLVHKEQIMFDKVKADPVYQQLFEKAYGKQEPDKLYTVTHVAFALASFQRTLISGESPYDRYILGDAKALTSEARRGMELFFSEKTECFHCHGGFNFSDSTVHDETGKLPVAFHNTGLKREEDIGWDVGVYEVTGQEKDKGMFKAPTLRNIAVTGPYMHDGSLETLEEVIRHYATVWEKDGRTKSDEARISEFIPGFAITEQETKDLVAFLESLTDAKFLADERFSDPWLKQREGAPLAAQ